MTYYYAMKALRLKIYVPFSCNTLVIGFRKYVAMICSWRITLIVKFLKTSFDSFV